MSYVIYLTSNKIIKKNNYKMDESVSSLCQNNVVQNDLEQLDAAPT